MIGAGKKSMAWCVVRQVRLDYYSTRRDGQGGWMQMKISGPGGHIRIDSALDGFARLAGEAAANAAAQGIAMTETTRGNLKAMGVAAPPAGAEAGG
jgi:hypothetical protein